jgi:hypothetical protein
MGDSPIYVAGISRSGTTLTTEVLARNSQIAHAARGAVGLLKDIDALRAKLGGACSEAAARAAVLETVRIFYAERNDAAAQADVENLIRRTDLAGRLLSAAGHGEMLRMFLDADAMRAGKRRWVHHSTGSLYNLRRIFADHPGAKVVLCVRHPLDYLVSYRDSFKRAARRHRIHGDVERLRSLYHPVITSLLWVSCARAIRKALESHGERVMLSRYEELVEDPGRSVRRLCAFVGCEFEPRMLEVDGNNSSESVRQDGIFSTSVGRWKKGLSPAEAFIAQLICGREMRRFGYAREAVRADFAEVVRQLLTTPFFAWRALRVNQSWQKSRLRQVSKQFSALVRG